MDRDIKFRAWNKRDKYMQDVAELSWRHGGLHVEDAGVHIGNGWVTINPDCKELVGVEPNAVLEQFTGLYDCNDKPIYEGDILVVPDTWTEHIMDDGSGPIEDSNHLAPVVFCEQAFGVMLLETADYLDKGFASFLFLAGEVGLEKIEIVGNIHENPELLED